MTAPAHTGSDVCDYTSDLETKTLITVSAIAILVIARQCDIANPGSFPSQWQFYQAEARDFSKVPRSHSSGRNDE